MNDLNQILKELYMIDDSLRQREEELKKIIAKLIESNPEISVDQKFVAELKDELLMQTETTHPKEKTFSLQALIYSFGGVLAIVVLAVFITYLPLVKNKTVSKLTFKSGITVLGDNAFGKISINPRQENLLSKSSSAGSYQDRGGAKTEMSTPTTFSGTEQTVQNIPARDEASGAGASGKISGVIPNYEYYNIDYVYKGEPITVEGDKMAVYKKINSKAETRELASQIISGINSNFIDLSKLQDTELTNITISENREFGYQLSFNSEDSSFNIFANWSKWPQPFANCRDDDCYKRNQLKIEDVPSNDEAIEIAKQFLKDYGINLDGLGEPVINNNWRVYYEKATDKASIYIPDTIVVIFPYKINDQIVYNTSGDPVGLNVEVNSRYKKVNSLYNFSPLNFASSDYEVEKDAAAITKQAENGGLNYSYRDPNAKTKTVELDTPKIGLVSYYKYDQDKNESYELYIPVFIFEVKDEFKKDIDNYRQRVVVPIVKGVITKEEMPTPLTAPAAREDMPMVKTESVK